MTKITGITGAMALALLSCARAEASSLDMKVIDQTVHAEMPAFKECYEEGIARRPELAGKITTKFVIDGAGEVLDVKVVSTTLHDKAVQDCVVATFGSLTFPSMEGAGCEGAECRVNVTYPLTFTPNEDDAKKKK